MNIRYNETLIRKSKTKTKELRKGRAQERGKTRENENECVCGEFSGGVNEKGVRKIRIRKYEYSSIRKKLTKKRTRFEQILSEFFALSLLATLGHIMC